MPLDDIPNLRERSAVSSSPFFINDENKIKKSSSMLNLPESEVSVKSSPFFKLDQERKKESLKRTISLKTPKKQQMPKKESMLDLLRNFDHTEKKERIVYQSRPPLLKKEKALEKAFGNEVVYEEGGSLLDRLKKFTNTSKPVEPKTLFTKKSPETVGSKNSVDTSEKESNCEIVHEQNGSIKDRLNKYHTSLLQNETPAKEVTKPNQEKAGLQNEETLLVKDIQKLAMGEKNSEIVYEEGGSLSERRKKFLNDTNPRIPVASFSTPITKSTLQGKKPFEETINQIESAGALLCKVEGNAKEAVDKIETGVSEMDIPKTTSPELESSNVPTQMESGAINLDFPEISLGSIFEEKDQWITNLWGLSNVERQSVEPDYDEVSVVEEQELEQEPDFNTSLEQIDHIIDSYDGQGKKECILDVSKSSDTLKQSSDELSIPKSEIAEYRMKKSVSFASAWKGDLENTKMVCSDPAYFDEIHENVGRLLIKITNIHDVFIASEYDRVIDLEICQGVMCQTSPPYTLKQSQTSLSVDWETQISVVPNTPIHFRLKVRQVLQNEQGMKQSSSSKSTLGSGIMQMSSKFLTKFSQNNLTHSGSLSSITSASSANFKKEPIFGSVQNMRTGHFMVCNVQEWVTEMSNQVSTAVFELFEIDFSKPKMFSFKKTDNVISIGKITSQVFFMKSISHGNELLPISLSEYKDDLQTVALHSKVWKEGRLKQLGGDCSEWKSRFFRLIGTFLIGYHETTLDVKTKICLGQLEAIKFNDRDDFFSLEFRDGEIIKFQCSEDRLVKHEWIEAIEDSQNILADNPLPAWAQ
ncbi:Bud site selection protein bud4 [Terramyces sp. JEL0728]|nr:Bud site selection protein bud4 [Terramyces sp. JEL0728]